MKNNYKHKNKISLKENRRQLNEIINNFNNEKKKQYKEEQ